ncbi:hypothetical protein EPO15_04370 [bacterium]|nr:MAG: hypothetical protein EPO15_04370 [bacterium]
MKKTLALLLLVTAVASPVRAQKAGDIGVGVILGSPTGGAAKLWLSDHQALSAGIGFSSSLAVYGDYLWHSWSVLPQPSEGRLPVYLGLGGQIRTLSPDEFGVRGVLGLAYWLPRNPVELFVEFVPVVRVAPWASVGLGGGIGLRYYFIKS